MNIQQYFEFSPLILAIVPVIIGLVAIAKGVDMPTKYAPILAIVLGIGLVALTGGLWQSWIIQGIIAGLAASGLWSGARAVTSSSQ